MTTKTFNEDTWVICYGPDVTHVSLATAGSVIGTGQPNIEEFDTLEECYEFARALGWIEPAISPLPESEWPEGFVPNLDEDGMQLCYDTEPLWVLKPENPAFEGDDTVVDVEATVVDPSQKSRERSSGNSAA